MPAFFLFRFSKHAERALNKFDSTEFNKAIRQYFIPTMIDNKDYLKAFQGDIFSKWNYCFTSEVELILDEYCF